MGKIINLIRQFEKWWNDKITYKYDHEQYHYFCKSCDFKISFAEAESKQFWLVCNHSSKTGHTEFYEIKPKRQISTEVSHG